MDDPIRLLSETLAAYGRAPRTQETYGWMLLRFTRFIKKPLEDVTPEDIREYQRYLIKERKVSFSALNQATCALRFFYRECLGKADWAVERLPYQRKRRSLPEILAEEEVVRLFDACCNLKHRALLMTAYGGGLRLTETLNLLPSDIDSKRMLIRIDQGKGRKDRYVMLPEVLLTTLREYWKEYRPHAISSRARPRANRSAHPPPRRSSSMRRSRRGSPSTCTSTRCGTRSPRTSWKTAPTST